MSASNHTHNLNIHALFARAHQPRRCCLLLLTIILAACTPATPAAIEPTLAPTPSATATPLPPDPQTALEAALTRFDEYQSYTLNTTLLYESGAFNTAHTTQTTQIVEPRQAATLIDSASETLITSTYQKYCIGEKCYKTDATGLFKPSTGHYYPPKPALNFLGLYAEHVLDNGYTYVGEEMKNGRNAFKYQVQASDVQLADPELDLTQPAPEIDFYVDAQSGDLLAYDTDYYKTNQGRTEHYQLSMVFSQWNASEITKPDVVEPDNTEWQTYNGAYSDAVTFEIPKVVVVEDYGYPYLKAPSGSRMDFQLYASIGTLSVVDEHLDADKDLICEMAFREFVLANDKTGQTLERAEWLEAPNYSFCKAIVNTKDGQEARYLFNEPVELTQLRKDLLPQTFYITVTPAEGEDVDTVFWDVIQTIQLGAGLPGIE
ncbi:MAG: hypothetical protein PWQ55_1689 [Chloroflexota bacterium]|nr:hypothetical protein [Chloroflexota bacterium]